MIFVDRVDRLTSDSIIAAIHHFTSEAYDLIELDLRLCPFLDAAGLHAIEGASIAARRAGTEVIIIHGSGDVASRMLELHSRLGNRRRGLLRTREATAAMHPTGPALAA